MKNLEKICVLLLLAGCWQSAEAKKTKASEQHVYFNGVVTDAFKSPRFVVDGVVTPSLDYLNIHDVESVEVLKDASIYGVRGANGAILVHTKTGKRK